MSRRSWSPVEPAVTVTASGVRVVSGIVVLVLVVLLVVLLVALLVLVALLIAVFRLGPLRLSVVRSVRTVPLSWAPGPAPGWSAGPRVVRSTRPSGVGTA